MGRTDFPPYYISAYGLAVRQGFQGTLDEWLTSLRGAATELRCQDGVVQWRWITKLELEEGVWKDLYLLTEEGVVSPDLLEQVINQYFDSNPDMLEQIIREYLEQNVTVGADGVTFTPAVSEAGLLSWSNDGGRENPADFDFVAALFAALPETVELDFTNWARGAFTETLSNGDTFVHSLGFDDTGLLNAVDGIRIVGLGT